MKEIANNLIEVLNYLDTLEIEGFESDEMKRYKDTIVKTLHILDNLINLKEQLEQDLKDSKEYEKIYIEKGDLEWGFEEVLKWDNNVEYDAGYYFKTKMVFAELKRILG